MFIDQHGFGRPEEVGERTWSVKGPDGEDHSTGCMFYVHRGILPCSCDYTRRELSTWWWKCWLRWQEVRVLTTTVTRVKWPVKGPDGSPWVPGVDFNDNPALEG